MRTELFDYELPDAAIATEPAAERDGARLCIVGPATCTEGTVRQFPSLLNENDLLVLNETKVRAARARCVRPKTRGMGGGQVEVLFLRPLGGQLWQVLTRSGSRLGSGDLLEWPEAGLGLTLIERQEGGTAVVRSSGDVDAALERVGEMPLPPYMRRKAEEADRERYQTVFAKELGSAAAPTAGLHFTQAMFEEIRARGVRHSKVTLHVGLGTFRPVGSEDLDRHPMHEEWYCVGESLVSEVAETRARGGRVVAVGTTVVRALESAAREGALKPHSEMTRLLIQPGFQFRVVDALFTNFHQPRSTLLALVSAFAGRERMLSAYDWALKQGFRFLSYGDAMWVPHRVEL